MAKCWTRRNSWWKFGVKERSQRQLYWRKHQSPNLPSKATAWTTYCWAYTTMDYQQLLGLGQSKTWSSLAHPLYSVHSRRSEEGSHMPSHCWRLQGCDLHTSNKSKTWRLKAQSSQQVTLLIWIQCSTTMGYWESKDTCKGLQLPIRPDNKKSCRGNTQTLLW